MLHFSSHANGFAYWYINRFLRFVGRHDRMKPVDGVICLFEYGTAAETEGRETMDIQVGDVLKLKKPHPCGSKEWEVLRAGMDFRLKCNGCGHQIMIPRKQLERNVRQIVPAGTASKEDGTKNM